MYESKNWLDEVKDGATGETLQRGTPMSAANFNNMEHGISDAHIATALTMIAVHQSAE